MKPLKTKAQIRAEIEQQMHAYLEQGGSVKDVPAGVSGTDDNRNPFSRGGEQAPRQERTPLTDVMREIDARKKPGKKSANSQQRPRRPQRKLITDDFGEPIRWVWED